MKMKHKRVDPPHRPYFLNETRNCKGLHTINAAKVGSIRDLILFPKQLNTHGNICVHGKQKNWIPWVNKIESLLLEP